MPEPSAARHGRVGRRAQALRLTIVAATAILTGMWVVPVMPEIGLDASWGFALNQAVSQGLRFGDDVTFSFGPYVSVYTRLYHPETAALTFAASLYLTLSLWLGLATLGAYGPNWILALLGATIFALRPLRDAQLFFPVLIAGLIAHRHALTAPADRQRWRTVIGTALVFAPLGLLPLIKGSSLPLVLAVVAASAVGLSLAGRWTLAAAVVVTPVAASLGWWVVAGQPLAVLPGYLRSIIEMSAGYSAAMSVSGDAGEVGRYLAVSAAFLFICLYLDRDSRWARRGPLLVILAAFLFTAFKAGFVRHDGHAFIAAGSILLASLCMPLVFGRRALSIAALAAWLFIDTNARHGYLASRAAARTATAIGTEVAAVWIHWRDWNQWSLSRYRSVLAAINVESRIPPLPGTVDIYSYNLVDVLAAGVRWSPRPTIQSYAAYMPGMAARNRDHLVAEDAPQHVVFRVEPIDNRLPPMEDGASWPLLLSHYVPTGRSPQTLILDRRSTVPASADLPLVREDRYQLGESIPIPSSEAPLFAEINVLPTPLGQLMSFFYKPTNLSISLVLNGGDRRSYRLIPGMAASGFVVSPLVERTREFAMLFANPSFLEDKRVSSIVVGPDGGSGSLWQNAYTMRLRRVPIAPVDLTGVLDFGGFSPAAPADAVADHRCEGYIDRVNGQPARPTVTSGLLSVEGWLAVSVNPDELPDAVYVVLTDASGRREYGRAAQVHRPDVANHLKNPMMAGAGFSLTADVSSRPGAYTFEMALLRGRKLWRCPQQRGAFEVRPSASSPVAAP